MPEECLVVGKSFRPAMGHASQPYGSVANLQYVDVDG